MIREMNIQEIYLNQILSGDKKFEGRLGSEKNKILNLGDIIIFNKIYKFKIVSIHIFTSYEDAFKVLNYKDFIPDAKNVEEAIGVYLNFYSKKKQKKYGVYVFQIKKFNHSI